MEFQDGEFLTLPQSAPLSTLAQIKSKLEMERSVIERSTPQAPPQAQHQPAGQGTAPGSAGQVTAPGSAVSGDGVPLGPSLMSGQSGGSQADLQQIMVLYDFVMLPDGHAYTLKLLCQFGFCWSVIVFITPISSCSQNVSLLLLFWGYCLFLLFILRFILEHIFSKALEMVTENFKSRNT